MKDVVRILIAPLRWLALFSAVYGLHGFTCGTGVSGMVFGWPLARVLLIAAYGAAVVAQAVLLALIYANRFASPSTFVRFVSRATGWVGLVATIWTLLPIAVTTSCSP